MDAKFNAIRERFKHLRPTTANRRPDQESILLDVLGDLLALPELAIAIDYEGTSLVQPSKTAQGFNLRLTRSFLAGEYRKVWHDTDDDQWVKNWQKIVRTADTALVVIDSSLDQIEKNPVVRALFEAAGDIVPDAEVADVVAEIRRRKGL